MTLQKVTLESKNKLGSLSGYLTSQKHKAGVIVIQEVNLNFYFEIKLNNLIFF